MSNETSGSKAEDNSQALAAFVARKADIDTVLARLIALSSDHFSRAPDRVTWGDVGTLASYLTGLREISDAAFRGRTRSLIAAKPFAPTGFRPDGTWAGSGLAAAQLHPRQITVSKLRPRGNRASPSVDSAHPVRWNPFGRQIDDLATGRRGAIGAARRAGDHAVATARSDACAAGCAGTGIECIHLR